MKNYLRILKYLKPYWVNVALSLMSNILTAIFSLFSFLMIVPFLQILFGQTQLVREYPGFSMSVDGMTELFNYHMSQFIMEDGQVAALVFICILVAITSFLKNFFRYFSMWVMAPARNGVSRDVRNDLFSKILALPLSYFSEEKKGDLLTRSSSDVQEVENSILNTLEVVFKEPVTILFYMGTLFIISPVFTLYVLILLLVTTVIIGRIGRKLKMAAREGQGKLSILLSILEESLTGMRIIKAFNAEKKVGNRFKKENQLYYRIMRALVRKRDLSSPLTEFLATGVVL
jgi:subfamily B ATP-binding cassette protein MsbA